MQPLTKIERRVLTAQLVEDFYNHGKPITEEYTQDKMLHGLTIYDIVQKDDKWWEECHAFVQILFPNILPSKMNPYAPVIESYDVFKNVLIWRIEMVVDRFLAFLGMFNNLDGAFFVDEFDQNRLDEWINPSNHNILRITRLLHFLRGVGMIFELEDLRAFLIGEAKVVNYVAMKDVMGYTISVWENA